MIRIVSASRLSHKEFGKKSLLGQSLSALHGYDQMVLDVEYGNADGKGLPQVYNTAIARAGRGDTLVFVHDDVWLEDVDLATKLDVALSAFDVIGVAGNVSRVPGQPAWAFTEGKYLEDEIKLGHLSGTVAHGKTRDQKAETYFGPAPQRVKLLDGVFLATRSKTLKDADVRFEERFLFHFYDLDFCRSCETKA